MGLLSLGTPLSWPASAPYRQRVHTDGIEQFLYAYHQAKNYQNHQLKWGDEVEYLLLHHDVGRRKSTLLLSAPRLLPLLQEEEQRAHPAGTSIATLWRPEYATWMLEGTPGIPYRCYAADLVNVERNMALRRSQIQRILGPSESVLTVAAFPRVGVSTYTTPPALPFGPVARSYMTSDAVINPHPRFPTLSRNIRQRRGSQVRISLPVFRDVYTREQQPLIPDEDEHRQLLRRAASEVPTRLGGPTAKELDELNRAVDEKVKNTIVMDSSAFGMGSCCLQVTIQGRDMDESRHLYDQLAVVAPLLLALTAATPAIRGMLVDTDVRWDVISSAMDDRTTMEIESGKVPKPRYSSIDCFLSSRTQFKPESYNDLPVPRNEVAYNRLVEGGVDNLLAQHIAHLFIRDPLVVYEEKVEQDNKTSTDHFENIQSTNWNTVRFKLPPPGTDIGWRTEFRSMEVGLTDFENAAFSVFMVILSRVVLAFNLDFYVPMSKVDANMRTAHRRDAVRSQLFYFRKNLFKNSDGANFVCEAGHIHNAHLVGGLAGCEDIDNFCHSNGTSSAGSTCSGSGLGSGSESEEADEFELMTMDEIMNGKPLCRNGLQEGFQFPGLVPLMRGYLDALEIDGDTRARLFTYLEFVSQRASGKLLTNASYIRKFIRQHPRYKHDSVVSDEVCYDLMKHLEAVSNREVDAPELLGEFYKKSFKGEDETTNSMMMKMQVEPVGTKAVQLEGSEMREALRDTIFSIASGKDDRRCRC